ncbi:MAG: hypothetical protein A2277_00075 [Desulfobacterales bacterium RIFOXYA12_FULL_46_15]|nr:MAG: hypothetical protein A2277_00075 [Desulfobacterales bacterium RIFOXYA12_FULL_46_15]
MRPVSQTAWDQKIPAVNKKDRNKKTDKILFNIFSQALIFFADQNAGQGDAHGSGDILLGDCPHPLLPSF